MRRTFWAEWPASTEGRIDDGQWMETAREQIANRQVNYENVGLRP